MIEFNCRFGDPETQPAMSRLKSELVWLLNAAIDGRLDEMEIFFDDRTALTVMMASRGYPGSYEVGKEVSGFAEVLDAKIVHAGTTLKDGQVLTSGGRVLGVTALGKNVRDAQAKAYEAVSKISFGGGAVFRTDIGYRAIGREKN